MEETWPYWAFGLPAVINFPCIMTPRVAAAITYRVAEEIEWCVAQLAEFDEKADPGPYPGRDTDEALMAEVLAEEEDGGWRREPK